MKEPLAVGDRAPAFTLTNQDGDRVALQAWAPGVPVLLSEGHDAWMNNPGAGHA